MLFVLKTTYLIMCQHLPRGLASTRQTRRHSPCRVARTCQTRQHLPSILQGIGRQADIFEKNMTRLPKFARVIRESRKFGASCHCLLIMQINVWQLLGKSKDFIVLVVYPMILRKLDWSLKWISLVIFEKKNVLNFFLIDSWP
jgi:hypothetical protein